MTKGKWVHLTKSKAIILAIVLVLAGAGGWLVYDNNKQSKPQEKDQQSKEITNFDECVAAGNPVMESYPEQCAANGKTYTNTKQVAPQPKTVDETANWLPYTAKDGSFTIRVADGWVVEDSYYSNGFNTFDNDNLAHKPGTKGIVSPYPGGRDGSNGFFLNYATQNIEQIVTPGTKQASLQTKDGLEIEKYYWIISGQTDEGLGASNGDTQYTYVIRKSANRVISASYTFKPSDNDHHDIIEKVLTTTHFN